VQAEVYRGSLDEPAVTIPAGGAEMVLAREDMGTNGTWFITGSVNSSTRSTTIILRAASSANAAVLTTIDPDSDLSFTVDGANNLILNNGSTTDAVTCAVSGIRHQ